MKTAFYFLILCVCSLLACSTKNNELNEINQPQENVLTGLFSTPPEELLPADYIHWVENPEHGLVCSNTIDNYTYTAFYKPLDYVVLKDLDSASANTMNFKKQLGEYSGLQYYTLTIERSDDGTEELLRYDLNSTEDYFARIEYYSFKVQHDVILLEGEDTLTCRMSHFERAYGLQSKAKIILGFEKRKGDVSKIAETTNSDKTLVFYDRIFGAGIVKLRIDKSILNSIPKLKLG
ncbi:MAG: hypothetical protein JWM14_1278 [Chitinophagaceae bacterium]|nr:hypothetical protein [Chitinophagaceae bacterium]